MEQTPLISVIVPVYNQEKFIGRCIRSLLDQTMSRNDYEIIVIDDGSTDRTPYALTLFYDSIKLIKNYENIGLPASLNKGILASKASFVIRVDSDDYVNENYLKFMHYYLEQNPQIDAVACDYLLVDDEENVLERIDCVESPIGCAVTFRKQQMLDLGLYDEKFHRHEDQDFRIRFEKEHNISHLPIPLYRYRRHENNITNDQTSMKEHLVNLHKKHGL